MMRSRVRPGSATALLRVCSTQHCPPRHFRLRLCNRTDRHQHHTGQQRPSPVQTKVALLISPVPAKFDNVEVIERRGSSAWRSAERPPARSVLCQALRV